MSGIADYLLGIVAVCLISSVAKQLLGISKNYKALGNTIIGIFIVLSILSPVVTQKWSYGDVLDTGFEDEIEQISQDAESYRQEVMRKSIISQTEAYILSKARELSVDVDIEITLSDSYPYAPIRICIWGNTSPYAKSQLSAYLKEEIGIAKEEQIWMEARS
jgi:hypothetical protein